MPSNALYFPYIRTPEDAWFTRVLLYWDSVGTIVPGGLEDDPKCISRRMAELREEGMLQTVSPAFDLSNIPRFREEFARFLEADEIVARRRRGEPDGLSFTKVHVFKLGDVAEYLIAQGLARYGDGPGWEVWIDVEERTAGLFMAYLAATLGALDDVRMDPVTDHTLGMAALVGIDSGTGLTLKRARELRFWASLKRSCRDLRRPSREGPQAVQGRARRRARRVPRSCRRGTPEGGRLGRGRRPGTAGRDLGEDSRTGAR